MRKCLVIGDSLPMPTDELPYDDTWIHHLCTDYAGQLEVIPRLQRASSVSRLSKEGPGGKGKDAFEFYRPEIVITHIGLPDAAPRLLPRNKRSTRLINQLPFSGLIYNYLRRHGGRKIEYCDLTVDEFAGYFDSYLRRIAPEIWGGVIHCVTMY